MIRLTYPGARVLLNFGRQAAAAEGTPDFASRPCDGEVPGRTGAVWLR